MSFSLALGLLLTFSLGFLVGFWRGESVSGRKVVDYWLTSKDGRVNWSRVTAAVGLTAFAVLEIAFVHVYIKKLGVGLTEELLVMTGASLGIAGINLGQYLISKRPSVVADSSTTTTTTTDTARTSSAKTTVDA